jgi:hypothetical protein
MLEVFKLAMQVIAEVLDLIQRTESGVITPEEALKALEGFKKQILSNDQAADKAVKDKFSKGI